MQIITISLLLILAAVAVLGQVLVLWDMGDVCELQLVYDNGESTSTEARAVTEGSTKLALSPADTKDLVAINLFDSKGKSVSFPIAEEDIQTSQCGRSFIQLGSAHYHSGNRRHLQKRLEKQKHTTPYKPY